MSMVKRIGLDADDVLFDFWGTAIPVFNRKFGMNVSKDAFHKFDSVCPVFDITPQEFLQIIIDEGVLERMEPYPGVPEFVQRLKNDGHHVSIVTSRAYHPGAHRVTTESLDRCGIPFNQLHIKENGKTKSDYLDRPVDIFVDDLPDNLVDIKSSGKARRLALITQPWNTKVDDFERYRCLTELALG